MCVDGWVWCLVIVTPCEIGSLVKLCCVRCVLNVAVFGDCDWLKSWKMLGLDHVLCVLEWNLKL